MAYQKSLVFVALVVVLGVYQQVSALEVAEMDAAYNKLIGPETLDSAETEKLLIFLEEAPNKLGFEMRYGYDQKFDKMKMRADHYLEVCQGVWEGKPRGGTNEGWAEMALSSYIYRYETYHKDSPSIIKYLKECQEKRFGSSQHLVN